MKHILLIYDAPNWTWHHQARSLQKHAPAQHHFEIISSAECSALGAGYLEQWDAVFSFSWSESPKRPSPGVRFVSLLAHDGCRWPRESEDLPAWLSTTDIRCLERAEVVLPRMDGLIAVNHQLAGFGAAYAPTRLIPAGVDHKHFSYCPLIPPARTEPLVIGWCGQVPDRPGSARTKGYHEVLVPLMAEMADDNVAWRLLTGGHTSDTSLSYDEMPQWYREIDVFLCTSVSEGTPCPVFEAASVGRPVVSTEVGAVPMLVNGCAPAWHNQASAEAARSVIRQKLRHYERNRGLLSGEGRILRRRVEERWTWERLAGHWLEFIGGMSKEGQVGLGTSRGVTRT